MLEATENINRAIKKDIAVIDFCLDDFN